MKNLKARLKTLEKTVNADSLQDIPAAELAAMERLYPDEYADMMRLPPEERIIAAMKITAMEMKKHC